MPAGVYLFFGQSKNVKKMAIDVEPCGCNPAPSPFFFQVTPDLPEVQYIRTCMVATIMFLKHECSFNNWSYI